MEYTDKTSWNFTKLNWLSQHMVGHNGFIAGGCFKQIFKDQRVKDIDIFFDSEEEWAGASEHYKRNDSFEKRYVNKKVEAYKHKKTGLTVELIRTIFGSPEEVLNCFDFTITKFVYYKQVAEDENSDESIEYRCLYHPQYFEHLLMKRLVLDDGIPFPASTFERMVRYVKYGYFPCRDTKIALIDALRAMPEVPDLSESMYDGLD